MKANRARCLRCEEPLPTLSAAAGQPSASPVNRTWIVAAGGAIAGLLVVMLMWPSQSVPSAQPPRSAAPANAPVVTSVPLSDIAVPATSATTSVTLLDSTRVASAAFTSGDFQTARTRFEEALQKNPSDPDVLNNLGLVLERLGDIEGAVGRFERAVVLAPDKWAYRFNLAHILGRQSNWDRAIAEYREAVRLFPVDYATQFNLAMALQKKGDDQAAIPEFEKAIALAPSEPTFYIALGNSLAKAGRVADARRAFESYLELEPSAPDAAKVKEHIAALAGLTAQSPAPPSGASSATALP